MRGSFKKGKKWPGTGNKRLSHNDVHNNARDMTFARRVCICMYVYLCICIYISYSQQRKFALKDLLRLALLLFVAVAAACPPLTLVERKVALLYGIAGGM